MESPLSTMSTEMFSSDRVQVFFNSLETHKSLLHTCTDLYRSLSSHFTSFQTSLEEKSQALDSKIQAFDIQTQTTLESLCQRENQIPELESSLAASIEDKTRTAVKEIEKYGTVNVGPEKSENEETAVDKGENEEAGMDKTVEEKADGEQTGNSDMDRVDFLQLMRLCCTRMDGEGLMKYLVARRKETMAMRSEIAKIVVEDALDVENLVLDVVEEYLNLREAKVGVADRRWACGVLVQGVFDVWVSGKMGLKGLKGVAESVTQRAARVTERWKGFLEGTDVGASEVAMFLHIVVVFGLKEKFEEDFLRKLVVGFASRKDMSKIAAALGFGEKMGDIIEELVNGGKEIEAIYFASDSGLAERFPPVSLLKSYLRNSRKIATDILKKGNYNTAATDEASTFELSSIKAIIKCVEDHNLEPVFAIGSLRKRVPQLEKARADRKKSAAASTSKPSSKRSHGRGGSGQPGSRAPKAGRFSNAPPSFGRRNIPQAHAPPAARYSAPAYNYPSQGSVYDAAAAVALYGHAYGGDHSQSPAAVPQQYPYAPNDAGAPGVRTGGSYAGHPNYGVYDYSAAAAVAAAGTPPAFPPSYPQ